MTSFIDYTENTKTCNSKPIAVFCLYNAVRERERENESSSYENSETFLCKKASFIHHNFTLYHIAVEIFYFISVVFSHLIRTFLYFPAMLCWKVFLY